MAVLKIARMGHPVLRRRADPVADPTASDIRHLVRDMLETLADIGGIGLAAPQVHVPLRVVIFEVPAERAATGKDATQLDDVPQGVPMTVLINPEIEPLAEDKALGWEACLSVPGLTGAVPRWTRISYRGFGLKGERIEREASDFHARVVQHECDHLDGILYPMRMADLSTLAFAEELRHGVPKGAPGISEEEAAALAEG
ncbi:MAG: peptide deformylase [Dongiaceae bacterium]